MAALPQCVARLVGNCAIEKVVSVNTFPATLLLALVSFAAVAAPQQQASVDEEDERTTSGTVVSSTRSTIVVRTDENRHQLFVFDRDTVRPRTIANGSSVRIRSVPSGERGARLARTVTVSGAAPDASRSAGAAQSPGDTDAIPPTVRRLERDMERAAKRYGVGVRAGAALHPELILVGVHANLGTVFTRDISLRPNLEFAFGEVTNMFAINLEGLYACPSLRVQDGGPPMSVAVRASSS